MFDSLDKIHEVICDERFKDGVVKGLLITRMGILINNAYVDPEDKRWDEYLPKKWYNKFLDEIKSYDEKFWIKLPHDKEKQNDRDYIRFAEFRIKEK